MRIISKFRDYYDSVLSYGMDKNLVYVRKTEEIKITEDFSEITEITKFSRYEDFSTTIYLIGFCGKTYLCFLLESKIEPYNKIYAYTKKGFIRFFKSFKKKEYLNYFLNNKDKTRYRLFKQLSLLNLNNLIEIHNNSDKYSELFFKYNTPIFIKKVSGFIHREDQNILTINPSLKEFEFYKIFDPFSAFQEISMFLGGVLGVGQPKLVNISNESMIIKKGFDKKWSFRKEPSKNKSK